jgi:hypothetical protein
VADAGDQVHGIAAWPAHVPEPGAIEQGSRRAA